MSEHAFVQLPARAGSADMQDLIKALAVPDLNKGDIFVSMSEMEFYEPSAVCALLAQLTRWKLVDGRAVTVLPCTRRNAVVGYIRHMGFFQKLGITDGGATAKGATANYVPIEEVKGDTKVDAVALKMVKAAMSGRSANDDVRQLLCYALGELLKNVQQHSRGTGYVMAQYYETGLFQIGIADNGIGIKESYITSLSPKVKGRETWNDAQWVEEAIRCQSSSKVHLSSSQGEGPVNRGIGLTMCRLFAKECLGHFELTSHSGRLTHEFKYMDKPIEPPAHEISPPYIGVLCSIAFNPSAMGQISFMDLRRQALTELGMLGKGPPLTGSDTMFSS